MEHGKHILLVDEDPSFRFSAGIVLRNAGLRVSEAGDGEEALRRFRDARFGRNPVDLLLANVRTPGMSALELIDEIRRLGDDVPFAVMTCCDEPCVSEEIRKRGCRDAIAKPFDPAEFVRRVRRALEDSSEPVC
ncbi:MAG: response regulator [Deltaproteobacteria bacterium]|nr:response regulator [Deltaproteobacteria bacterium]